MSILPIFKLDCLGRGVAVELHEFFVYFLDINLLSDNMICNYFLPFSRLSFHFVEDFFCYAEVFWFDVVPLVYLCCFCCYVEKDCQDLGQGICAYIV